MSCIRPVIAYTVSKLSTYTSNIRIDHRKRIVRVLRYLKYTYSYMLHFIKYLAVIERYIDANWISNVKDSKSTNRFVIILGGATK